MTQRNLYISRNCPHCKKLLIGLHKYEFLRPNFYIIDIETQQFPDYIQSVPTLVVDQSMIKNDDVFGYLNNMVEQIFKQNPELKQQYQQGQQQQGQQQQDGSNPQKVGKGHTHDPIDDLVGWCADGDCGFAPITESNDNCSKQNVSLEDTRFSFINESNDKLAPQPSKVPMEQDNSQFQKTEKQQQMDNSYERLMNERNLLK